MLENQTCFEGGDPVVADLRASFVVSEDLHYRRNRQRRHLPHRCFVSLNYCINKIHQKSCSHSRMSPHHKPITNHQKTKSKVNRKKIERETYEIAETKMKQRG